MIDLDRMLTNAVVNELCEQNNCLICFKNPQDIDYVCNTCYVRLFKIPGGLQRLLDVKREIDAKKNIGGGR